VGVNKVDFFRPIARALDRLGHAALKALAFRLRNELQHRQSSRLGGRFFLLRFGAARVFGVPYDEVTKEHRYRAKTVNFAIIYGAGATNLSQQLDIKRTEASELINEYFNQYSGIKNYMEETVSRAREQGYVKTLMGRRRQLRDINARSSMQRSMAERMAINTPIQGTAADMIKMAMINVHRAFQEEGFRSRMILQVHDELVFDAHKDELERIKPVIETHMKNALPKLRVPILVEMGVGGNWREAH